MSHARRQFLKSTVAATVISPAVWHTAATIQAQENPPAPAAPNTRKKIGCIGTGSRWNAVGRNAMAFGDVVAVCDVDARHLDNAVKVVTQKQGSAPDRYEDYRQLLKRDDIEVVTIVTPDHWHAAIAIEAMLAGKHVYCEKPLTLTIEEGQLIIETLERTRRIFQVGTQQRSEFELRFATAVALCHAGRLGKIQKVTCGIGGAPSSQSLPAVPPPQELNWDKWLGPAPLTDYRFLAAEGNRRPETRCHYEFRWWYEYSGGKMTDWGAHHVDIAHWAIGAHDTGPLRVKPVSVTHPVPLDENGMPTDPSRYNTATEFEVECQFADDVTVIISSHQRNGLLIEGDQGRIFVGRGALEGAPVDALKTDPLPEDALTMLHKGIDPRGSNAHMRNFFTSIERGQQPISDVYSHHRALTTCHLANIAIRLNRELQWDPNAQKIIDDEQAQSMLSRPRRAGYELSV